MSIREISDAVPTLKHSLMRSINQRLDQLRWTQAQMVLELEISQATASYLRRGAHVKISVDMLVQIAAKLGIRTVLQGELAPSWVDSAIRGGEDLFFYEDFEERSERPPAPFEAGGYSYPGRSATELVRVVAGDRGWRVYNGALYTADGDLIVTSLETAAAAMAELRWIRVPSGEVDLHTVYGCGAKAEAVLRTEADRLMGRAPLMLYLVKYTHVDDDTERQVLVEQEGGIADIMVWLLGGELQAECLGCHKVVPADFHPPTDPVFGEFHFACERCGKCVVYATDPRPQCPGDPAMGPVYCAGVNADDPGCEFAADIERAMEKEG